MLHNVHGWRRALIRSVAGAALLSAAACAGSGRPAALDRLHPCATAEGPNDGYCGTFEVFEHRSAAAGRRISLKIVVLPALGNDSEPDPLFFLAGGPGQGAAKMAAQVRDAFRGIQRTRDIVLVDQRGTGDSNPLECRSDTDSLRAVTESDDAALDRLRACLKGFDADVRLYTTPIAMDDLDDVRGYLGYERINLYGGSYGTRAALAYLRQHPDRVRSVVLDGVAPTDMRLPLFSARDAQRALDKLFAACDEDRPCHAAYGDLPQRVRTLLARLEQHPVSVRLVHPRTGMADDVTVDARFVASILFGALYSPVTGSILPALVDRAERDDFQGLLALGFAGSPEENLSVGMQLSVLCSEDVVRIAPGDIERETSGSVFGRRLLSGQMKACEFWPKGSIDPSYYQPVTSPVPALVLSGDADPVTPPSWGAEVASHLSRSRHVIVPSTGHGVIGTACGGRLIREFIDRGAAETLDTECVRTVKRPPFFLTPAGPDPAPSGKDAAP